MRMLKTVCWRKSKKILVPKVCFVVITFYLNGLFNKNVLTVSFLFNPKCRKKNVQNEIDDNNRLTDNHSFGRISLIQNYYFLNLDTSMK